MLYEFRLLIPWRFGIAHMKNSLSWVLLKIFIKKFKKIYLRKKEREWAGEQGRENPK